MWWLILFMVLPRAPKRTSRKIVAAGLAALAVTGGVVYYHMSTGTFTGIDCTATNCGPPANITDNVAFIDTPQAYVSAAPAVTSVPGDVTIRFMSKNNNLTVIGAFCFNKEYLQPTRLLLYQPHNITTAFNYTCNASFNFTLSPKHFVCYNSNNGTILVEHDFLTGNVSAKTAFWNDTTREEYVEVGGTFKKINVTFDNKTTCYYKTGIDLVANKTYEVVLHVNGPIISGLTGDLSTALPDFDGKYSVAFWPQSYGGNLTAAILDNQFYYLDPQFQNYPHNAYWNDTAETGTPAGQGWVTSTGTIAYGTLTVFNGTKSLNNTGVGPSAYVLMNSSTATARNLTIYFNYPGTSALTGSSWGMRNATGQCGNDGNGVCIGSRSITSATNFVTLIENTWTATSVPLSAGWHVAEWRITNNNQYNVTLDGTVVATGTGGHIGYTGDYLNFLVDSLDNIYFDDMHLWNATVSTDPCAYTSGNYAPGLANVCTISTRVIVYPNNCTLAGAGNFTIASGGLLECHNFAFQPTTLNDLNYLSVRAGGNLSIRP